ncbi:MAG: hypothetical protein ACI86X_001566 [Moritella sp.]|jgi:hypothetical protein
MREDRVMDWLKYPFFLFALVVTPLSGAKNISVVVSPRQVKWLSSRSN